MRPKSCLNRTFLLICSACLTSAAFAPASYTNVAWIANGVTTPLAPFSSCCRKRVGLSTCSTASLLGRKLIQLRSSANDAASALNATEAYRVNIVGACVIRDGSVLMVERRQRSRGYWEFPGGKVEEGEDDAAALVRELKEELNVAGRLVSKEPIATGQDGPVKLTCYLVDMDGEPRPSDGQMLSMRWMPLKELRGKPLPVPPMDRAVLDALLDSEGPKWGIA